MEAVEGVVEVEVLMRVVVMNFRRELLNCSPMFRLESGTNRRCRG